jgi:uracil-DNA glycosylase
VSELDDWFHSVPYFSTEEYRKTLEFVKSEREKGKSILPKEEDIFNALKYTKLKDVKVVILGQDPYPNKHHAHGLSFSIPKNEPDIPRTLKNIFKELESDLGVKCTSGNLESWAIQGVLLLNRVLTVEEGLSNSHKSKGWEKLTEAIIKTVNEKCPHVVFILWGNPAQTVEKWIDTSKHLVIKSAHPSPLSASRGFFSSKCFSRTNAFLKQHNLPEINWATDCESASKKESKPLEKFVGK